MFADRFDALMSIAEVSNSQLGRAIAMNPSHIGRLRSGARPLPKKHEYLGAICRYLAEHITKDYQVTALQKLTGIDSRAFDDSEDAALHLEQWLAGQTGREAGRCLAAGRFISGFSRYAPAAIPLSGDDAFAESDGAFAVAGDAFAGTDAVFAGADESAAGAWAGEAAVRTGGTAAEADDAATSANDAAAVEISCAPTETKQEETGETPQQAPLSRLHPQHPRPHPQQPHPQQAPHPNLQPRHPQKYAEYLFGNEGKRRAVEQFFASILQEEKPQTLLLFSDENMSWLYEDAAFAAHWAELFARVIRRGNRVRIIHTVSRDLNEMFEALEKWIPLYLTGMIEPYLYPRLRDGVFRRTLFIAPRTAAVVSSSIQQDTDDMLNQFLTNRAAVEALAMEYERYFSLCRPLMRIFTDQHADESHRVVKHLATARADAFLCCAMPPLFALPEALVRELSEQPGCEELDGHWRRSRSLFEKSTEEQRLSVAILHPQRVLSAPDTRLRLSCALPGCPEVIYTAEQYAAHVAHLQEMADRNGNLTVRFADGLERSAIIYLKEGAGVIVAKAAAPKTVFAITDATLMSAFRDYLDMLLPAEGRART